MIKENPDIFGIVRYLSWKENGKQVYGIRGIGETYKNFYGTWYHKIKPVWNNTDFPWDYNTFTEQDEQDLIEKYGEYILEDE